MSSPTLPTQPAESRGDTTSRWPRVVRRVLGLALTLLGLLWTLQGADLIQIRPILCVADCQPLTGGSAAWLITGLVALVVGLTLVGMPRRR